MSLATLRRAVRGTVVTAAAAAAVVLGTGTAHAIDAVAVTDDYLFNKSLSQFVSIRNQAPNSDQLDWSSDACSWSPDQPLGFDFKPACWRHDFGYRNYKKQGRFNETTRLTIDNNFKDDMYTICNGNSICNGAANVYYAAVRQFGAS